jgi:PAS domain S-box-containing protein
VLRRSEQRLRSLVQNGSDVIVVVSALGRITYASSSSMRILGWPSELLTGKFFVDLTIPADRKTGQELLATIVRQPMANTVGSLELILADGHTRPFEIIGNDLSDDTAVRGIVMNLRDISERRRVEKELRDARDKAEAASRAKSAFLANMSHELRTPLNAIIGFSELIINEGFGPIGNARYADYVRDINTSGSHLLGIINNILDLSKAEANRLELRDDLVDVAEAAAMSVTTIREQATRDNLQILIDIPAEFPLLRADEGKLRQILINILSNAVKFTKAGGYIALKAVLGPEGGMALTITDSGIGMPREKIAVAMEPFGQVDSALNRRYEGTGLGLPLTKRLVELHDGTLELDSEPGWGTRVKMAFPAARVVARANAAADRSLAS